MKVKLTFFVLILGSILHAESNLIDNLNDASRTVQNSRKYLTRDNDTMNSLVSKHRAKALRFLNEAQREINQALKETKKDKL